MRIGFTTDRKAFENEYLDVIRSFAPHIVLESDANEQLSLNLCDNEREARLVISSSFKEEARLNFPLPDGALERKRILKRHSKRELYFYISDYVGIRLPYGSLTGIRPTKLYYDLLAEGKEPLSMFEYFGVRPDKVETVKRIIETQRGIYGTEREKYDIFVNIPFCPSRCTYCSFISEVISRVKGRLEEYAECLLRDIGAVTLDKAVRRAVYIGGGTPTALPYPLLDKILLAVGRAEEFTVEAGRPDTLSEDIIAVLKANGVTRVSVNPQTFKQSTLALIGRAHTVKDIYEAYERADKAGFSINMDFIAALPQESVEDFADSLKRAIALKPDNITVHSLSIKRGSALCLAGYDNNMDTLADRMGEYAYQALTAANYSPYYMYRQKNTSGRLENIGYTKLGKACKYNIDIMEETHNIYASGAGAISKRVLGGGRIERLAEPKDTAGYIARIEEMIAKKKVFFK